MKVARTKKELTSILASERELHKSIGLVPTMGALHAGHISLVKRCVSENDVTVVSVFVNPTQFNDPKDLENYPRTFDADARLLEEAGCTVVFAPSVEEMYPEPDTRVFDFGMLDKVMEGASRKGHFNGVGQIVSKLFFAVEPDRAYFGEKDFQQIAVIKSLVRQLNLHLEIIPCPIVRESDGLALSSRNTLMNAQQRKSALNISKALFELQKKVGTAPLKELVATAISQIDADPNLKTDYLQIVDIDTLLPVEDLNHPNHLQACVAVQVLNSVRLIDNVSIK